MLNRKLSKKGLSLRGLFPSCHSRESGNPSSQSLRSDRSNLKGFSLIELMVAVAILAMAIFGIFHAYSTGFMGMADARDRTVATNYLREAMEDVKNMDFDKIKSTYKSVINADKKYGIYVAVSTETTNLKKIFTIVEWEDRNGIIKTVESSMLVHFIEVFALDPAKIILYADSYSVLNTTINPEGEGTFTKLTAVIKDIKGNTIIDWDGDDISFLIISGSEFGDLSGITSTTNGIAKETFTSNGTVGDEEIGYSKIEASVTLPNGNVVTDSVDIKITNRPVKIILTPNPQSIKAGDTNPSTITASLYNAANQLLTKSDLGVDVIINFSATEEGILSAPTTKTISFIEGSTEDASTEIILNSKGNPAIVTVFASATNLESGVTDVYFLGPPVSISISASPNSIYVDDLEGSTITVSLIDENGFNTNPTSGTITISLALTTNPNDPLANLEDDYLYFYPTDPIGVSKITKFKDQTLASIATITASAEGFSDNFVTINILSALIPNHIKISASSRHVKAGDASEFSTIKATIYDSKGEIVKNYSGSIEFTIPNNTSNAYFLPNNSPVSVENGFAAIKIASTIPGNATVNIVNPDPGNLTIEPSDGIDIEFYGVPDRIELTANPTEVYGAETSVITAVIYDVFGNIVVGESITFSTNSTEFWTFSNGDYEIIITPADGIATTELSSSGALGEANIGVSAISGTLTDSTTVTFNEGINLLLVDTPIYNSTDKTVTFNIRVTGKSIDIGEMKVSWEINNASERLSTISMKIPYDAAEEFVAYDGDVKSGYSVDIDDKKLLIGESTIKLTFVKDMAGKSIEVIFYLPIEGSYTIGPFLVNE
jgi:prepilin-type N-terminal cleavage/methylation domain-containing protein